VVQIGRIWQDFRTHAQLAGDNPGERGSINMIDLNNLAPMPEKPSKEALSVQLLDAAIDLNRIARGEISESPAVVAVLANLGLHDHQVRTGDDLRQAVDPQTIDIYSRVISQLVTEPTRSVNDLAMYIQKYSELGSNLGKRSGEQLSAMKDFFLALHRELLAEGYNRLNESVPDRV
jgi:hypothetical protein